MTTDVAPAAAALETLSDHELEALIGGATWYAKYHESMIADGHDDGSAAALTRREHFEALNRALRKLGVRLRKPS
jgi:hypothetical protein